ncbi:MAG: hypothetical protein AAF480_04660 [Actinomycetota bacterium]
MAVHATHQDLARLRRRRRTAIAAVAAAAMLAGATTVAAISSKGSEEFSQGPGIKGSVEVGDFFGGALAIGDFDNDGRGDLVAGAAYENFGSRPDVGQIHVVYGTRSGLSTDDDITIHQGTSKVKGKGEADDRWGSAVAVGDFDGDGYDDAVVGAAGEDTKKHVDAGGFTVLYGSSSGLRGNGSKTLTAASKGVRGPAEPHANLGHALAVGDFDGDGYDDVAVGAPGAGKGTQLGAGAVHVFYGSARGIRVSDDERIHQNTAGIADAREAGDSFGAALTAGDFDRDGRDDLAVGVPGESVDGHMMAGAVHIIPGGANGLRPGASTFITQASGDLRSQPGPDELFGASLASGDFDGNRRADLAIGSPGETVDGRPAVGMVHVLYGKKSGLKVTGSDGFNEASTGIDGATEAGDEFGLTLAVGDFNDNGRDDLAVGAPGEGIGEASGAGKVHVLFGGANGIRLSKHEGYRLGLGRMPGEPGANGGFSRAIAVGDIDGDDRADMVVGAPGQTVGNDGGAGMVVLLFG